MDITFDDVAAVIQDAKYQKAILDTSPRPSKRITPLGRSFNPEVFIETNDINCVTLVSEPLGQWFLDKFADLDQRILETETGAPPGDRPEAKFLHFVGKVYDLKRQDPSGVASFIQVLRLLREYDLEQDSLVREFLHRSSQKGTQFTIEQAMAVANGGQASFSTSTGKDLDLSRDEHDDTSELATGDEADSVFSDADNAHETDDTEAKGGDDGVDETDLDLEAKGTGVPDSIAADANGVSPSVDTQGNPAELAAVPSLLASESGFLQGMDAETEVATYDANKPGTRMTTGVPRTGHTAGTSTRMVAARTGVLTRLHKKRSVDLNEALDQLVMNLCTPIYDRLLQHKVGFAQYARFKTFAMQPISERQIEYHRVLGQGAFGTVHGCVVSQTGRMLAMKLMSKRKIKAKNSKSQVVAERLALETLARHPSPYCMKLRYAFQTKEAYHLVLPLAIGGDLKFHLRTGPFSEKRAKFYAAEIAVGLGHIHSLGFIMRDLKPRNILLDSDGHVKISDFGLAANISAHNLVKGRAGTEGYWSPEVINNHRYGVDADWWSYGTCVFELLTAFNPFSTKHTGLQTRNQGTRSAQIKYPRSVPPSARVLISALLDRNVETRLGTKRGVQEVLNPRTFTFWQGLDLRRIREGTHPVPWVPEKGQIYAASQSEMMDFEEDVNANTLRRIKLTPEDVIEFDDFVDQVEHQNDIVATLFLNADVVSFVDDIMQPEKKQHKGLSRKASSRMPTRASITAMANGDSCCSLM
eukprot:CAMPEP_0171487072 /NCGR_PEP_ID=MMETSP0958-20121227/1440_1 /TAXON_ID=87120 /ORGANISM="Aurantiochytrium limacinum, Strain ATCCMYA-1381" /LENGTH=754 /DNA_ID=CAMNT_0012020017 /DNA_START=425 /DNA_END=2688 /DNA_ORIENTATION=+